MNYNPNVEKEASLSLLCIILLLDFLDGRSLPGKREVFFLVFAGIDAWLEESLNLDDGTLLQKIQLWRAFLGCYLDVLESGDLLLVAVLVLTGDAN